MNLEKNSGFFGFYRRWISPPLHQLAGPGFGCRFVPTCSQYFEEAIQVHGMARGFFLGLKRLGHCHPWGGSGFQPVPAGGRLRKPGRESKGKE